MNRLNQIVIASATIGLLVSGCGGSNPVPLDSIPFDSGGESIEQIDTLDDSRLPDVKPDVDISDVDIDSDDIPSHPDAADIPDAMTDINEDVADPGTDQHDGDPETTEDTPIDSVPDDGQADLPPDDTLSDTSIPDNETDGTEPDTNQNDATQDIPIPPDVMEDQGADEGGIDEGDIQDNGDEDSAELDTRPDTATIDSITPMSAIENQQFVLTLTGTGFSDALGVRITGDSQLTRDYVANATTVESNLGGTSMTAAFDGSNGLIRGLYRVEVFYMDSVLDSVPGFRILSSSSVPPMVTDVSPDSAKSGRDRLVVVSGTGFKDGASVLIAGGGRAFESSYVAVSDEFTLTAIIQAGTQDIPVGDYDIWVTNPDGLAGKWDSLFHITDQAPPTITGISPARSGNAADVELSVTGLDFVDGAVVSLLGDAGEIELATSVTTAGIQLAATVPSGLATGVYPVRVTNPDTQYDTYYFYQVSNNSPGSLTTFETMTGSLNIPRWQHGLDAMIDGMGHGFLVATGGMDSSGMPIDDVEISQVSPNGRPGPWFVPIQTDPMTGHRIINRMNEPRSGASTARVGKTLFILGGRSLPDLLSPAIESVEMTRILTASGAPRLKAPTATEEGVLPAGRWLYRVSAVTPAGETLASSSVSYRGDEGALSIAWEPVKGAVGYNVFRCPAANCLFGDESALSWMASPDTRSFTDTGDGVLTPSPSGIDASVIPDDPASIILAGYSYVVTSIVTLTEDNVFESVPGRPVSVTMPGDSGVVSIVFDDVAAADGFRIYRAAGSGPFELAAELPAGINEWQDSLGPTTPGLNPAVPDKPLPIGSLSLFEYPTDSENDPILLNIPREGSRAVHVEMVGYDPTAVDAIAGVLIVLGGRAQMGPLPESIASVETIRLYADGRMGQPELESVEMITGRSFFGLGNSQDRLDNVTFENDDDDDPVDPDCEDNDGDGFFDATCGGTDCDDGNSAVNPDAWENLQNGIDDNCDGLVDVPTTGWGNRSLSGDGPFMREGDLSTPPEPVFLIAMFGNGNVLQTGDTGLRDIEAVQVDLSTGHLIDITSSLNKTFRLQANSDNGDVHGIEVALYQKFLFSFMGVGSENLGQIPVTLNSQSKRFPFCPPPAVGDPGDASFGCPGYTGWTYSDLAGNKRTSANATVTGGLGYYGLSRAFGYIYLVGGVGNGTVSGNTHRVLQ